MIITLIILNINFYFKWFWNFFKINLIFISSRDERKNDFVSNHTNYANKNLNVMARGKIKGKFIITHKNLKVKFYNYLFYFIFFFILLFLFLLFSI